MAYSCMSYFSDANHSRFLKFFDIAGDDECWPWKGSKTRDGYGLFSIDGANQCAHRYQKEMEREERIPRNLDASHTCDTRLCVNPRHVVVETRKQNVGRIPVERRAGGTCGGGAKIGHPPQGCFKKGFRRLTQRKLSPEQVSEIKASSDYQIILARRFCVSQTTIHRIKNGAIYK